MERGIDHPEILIRRGFILLEAQNLTGRFFIDHPCVILEDLGRLVVIVHRVFHRLDHAEPVRPMLQTGDGIIKPAVPVLVLHNNPGPPFRVGLHGDVDGQDFVPLIKRDLTLNQLPDRRYIIFPSRHFPQTICKSVISYLLFVICYSWLFPLTNN